MALAERDFLARIPPRYSRTEQTLELLRQGTVSSVAAGKRGSALANDIAEVVAERLYFTGVPTSEQPEHDDPGPARLLGAIMFLDQAGVTATDPEGLLHAIGPLGSSVNRLVADAWDEMGKDAGRPPMGPAFRLGFYLRLLREHPAAVPDYPWLTRLFPPSRTAAYVGYPYSYERLVHVRDLVLDSYHEAADWDLVPSRSIDAGWDPEQLKHEDTAEAAVEALRRWTHRTATLVRNCLVSHAPVQSDESIDTDEASTVLEAGAPQVSDAGPPASGGPAPTHRGVLVVTGDPQERKVKLRAPHLQEDWELSFPGRGRRWSVQFALFRALIAKLARNLDAREPDDEASYVEYADLPGEDVHSASGALRTRISRLSDDLADAGLGDVLGLDAADSSGKGYRLNGLVVKEHWRIDLSGLLGPQ